MDWWLRQLVFAVVGAGLAILYMRWRKKRAADRSHPWAGGTGGGDAPASMPKRTDVADGGDGGGGGGRSGG